MSDRPCPEGCVKQPTIKINSKGQRYFLVNRKRVLLADNITETDLLKWVKSSAFREVKARLKNKATRAVSAGEHGVSVVKPKFAPKPAHRLRADAPEGIQVNSILLKALNNEGRAAELLARPAGMPGRIAVPAMNSVAVALGDLPIDPNLTVAALRALGRDVKGQSYRVTMKKSDLIDQMKRDGFKFTDDPSPPRPSPALPRPIVPATASSSSSWKPPLPPRPPRPPTTTTTGTQYEFPSSSPEPSIEAQMTRNMLELDADRVRTFTQNIERLKSRLPNAKAEEVDEIKDKIAVLVQRIQAIKDGKDPYHVTVTMGDDDEQKGNGERGLRTQEIDALFGDDERYLATIGRDEIPTLLDHLLDQTECGFVMNLDPITEPGSHWVAVYLTPSSVEYFDSYGGKPDGALLEDLKPLLRVLYGRKRPLKVKWNTIRDQYSPTTCGWHAAKFVMDRLDGQSFKEATGYNKDAEDAVVKWRASLPRFPVMSVQQGEGFLDWVKSGYKKVKTAVERVVNGLKGPRMNVPPAIKRWLEANGDKQITEMTINRTPIFGIIDRVANWLSAGRWEANKRAQGYDKMFHLFAVIRLDDGTQWLWEKNQTWELRQADKTGLEVMAVPLPTGKSVTPNELFQAAEKGVGASKLWVYDAVSQNCQYAQLWLLQYSGLLTPVLKEFILQDSESVLKGLGLLERAAKLATDIAGGARRMLEGEGKDCGCGEDS